MHALTLLVLAITPQEAIDGAEIGTADQYVMFESHGPYKAERTDKKAGNTTLAGKWDLKDDTLEVKVSSCKGPACKELNKPYTAKISMMAERAMMVQSTSSIFPSGAYYCHYLGCEPRTGVELLSKGAKAGAVMYLQDHLIDKNKGRNSTVVWWGKKLQGDAGPTRIEYCPRDEAKAKKGAEELQADLADLPWLTKPEVKASAEKDCLWDVRLYIADDVTPPAKKR